MSDHIINTAVAKSFANAGKVYGKTLTVLHDAFRMALGEGIDENTIEDYQYKFYLNGVMSGCAVSEGRAHLVVTGAKLGGLAPFDFKAPETMGDKNRTASEQRVFDALKSAFSTARKRANFPMRVIAPRPPQAPGSKAGPGLTGNAQGVDAPRPVTTVADALATCSELAGELRAIANGKALTGDAGSILRDAIVAFGLAVKAARKAKNLEGAPKVKALPIAA